MNDFVLKSGDAEVGVALLGAEARRWRVGDVDLLWPGDPKVWPDISPILFPVVGWTRDGIRVDGKRYESQVHGFARGLTFAVQAQTADFVRLVVEDSEETRGAYPFAFGLAVEYSLSPTSLEMALEIANLGDKPMPYACGFHPGFNWPFGGAKRAGARVLFARAERAEVPVVAADGLFSDEMRAIPLEDGRTLPLSDDLLSREALCFINAASRSLRFEQADGSALEMALDDFPHFALWARPPAPFLSLEAWTGYGDPVGFTGELHEKPSMRLLAPGAKARHAAIFRHHAAKG